MNYTITAKDKAGNIEVDCVDRRLHDGDLSMWYHLRTARRASVFRG